MEILVFVYGSLKQGFGNHKILEDAEFICATKTRSHKFKMASLDAFPAVLPRGRNAIAGELYKVDLFTLAYLDMLESNGELYQRQLVQLDSGHFAWMYLFLYDLDISKSQPRVLTDKRVQTWTMPLDGSPDFSNSKAPDQPPGV